MIWCRGLWGDHRKVVFERVCCQGSDGVTGRVCARRARWRSQTHHYLLENATEGGQYSFEVD